MLSLLHANHKTKNNLDLTSLPCSGLVQRAGNLALGHLQVIWGWRSASLPPLESFSIDCSGWPLLYSNVHLFTSLERGSASGADELI